MASLNGLMFDRRSMVGRLQDARKAAATAQAKADELANDLLRIEQRIALAIFAEPTQTVRDNYGVWSNAGTLDAPVLTVDVREIRWTNDIPVAESSPDPTEEPGPEVSVADEADSDLLHAAMAWAGVRETEAGQP